jgi:hypothetical protein
MQAFIQEKCNEEPRILVHIRSRIMGRDGNHIGHSRGHKFAGNIPLVCLKILLGMVIGIFYVCIHFGFFPRVPDRDDDDDILYNMPIKYSHP